MESIPKPSVEYATPRGTRWQRELAAAGGPQAFEYPTDPKSLGPWIIGECVGKGASGRVKIARHQVTGQLAAVKIVPLSPLFTSRTSINTWLEKSEKQRMSLDREIAMMKLMNHQNILRLYDVYQGNNELYLILEYVQGGELFDFLCNKGSLSREEALPFFKQIIYGLNYAHTFSIIHRDLKPENILIASLSPPLIKIADWGMAAFAPPSVQLETSCGSPHYASPEIVRGLSYQGNATDIWSCGVILFALLTGKLPFDDADIQVLLKKVKRGRYTMPEKLDPVARDLISRMLVIDPNQRITIPQILSHPWITGPSPSLTLRSAESESLLPPSPSTLARPITRPDLVDPELFKSLCIIWGRHADPDGENVMRELCAPPEEGVLSKAFYFLLGKYRDEKSRCGNVDIGNKVVEFVQSKYKLPTLDFDAGWKLDKVEIDSTSEHERKPVHSRAKANAPVPAPVLDTPIASRGLSASRERPASPGGPRSPTKKQRASHHEYFRTPQMHTVTKSASSKPIKSEPIRTCPPIMKRGHTYHPQSETAGVRFLQQPQPQPQPQRTPTRPMSTLVASSAPAPPCSPPRPASVSPRLPLLTPPRTPNRDLQKTMCEIADRVNELVLAESTFRGRTRHPTARKISTASQGKENRSIEDEGWNHFENDEMRSPLLGRRAVGREIGNGLGEPKGGKEKRVKPPPLDFTSLARKRSITSAAVTPLTPSPVPTSARRLASPVVGEFKGWFSNLFNWKNQPHAGVLYSPDDIHKTRFEAGRLLQGLGISFGATVTGEGPDGASNDIVLKCQVQENVHLNLKSLRFRVEFTSAQQPLSSPASPNTGLLPPPTHGRWRGSMLPVKSGAFSTPPSPNPCFSHESSTAIILIFEKGSMSTFKAVWEQLKINYGEAPAEYPCFSPMMASTPVMEISQRFAI